MGASNLTKKRIKNVKISAVSDHLLESDYSTDFNKFDILAAETSKFDSLIKDSLLIKPNRTAQSLPLELFD